MPSCSISRSRFEFLTKFFHAGRVGWEPINSCVFLVRRGRGNWESNGYTQKKCFLKASLYLVVPCCVDKNHFNAYPLSLNWNNKVQRND